jgi:hypothetical protein
MVLAGVAIARAGVWRGWQRLLPLVVGIWILVPATPVMIVTGGPPSPLAVAAVTAWDILWAATGVLALQWTATTSIQAGVNA